MTVDRITPLGDNGELESQSTFDDWVADGFVDERVRYTRLNRQLNRADTKINELIDSGMNTRSAEISAVVTGLWPAAEFSSNELDNGEAVACDNVAVAVIDNARKIVCGASTAERTLYLYDVDTWTFESKVTISSATLPSDGNEYWIARNVIADDDSLYVVWLCSAPTSTYDDDCYVQAYDLTDWTVKSGWPATGTYLYENTVPSSYADLVIHASSTLLAVGNCALLLTGSSADDAVVLVNNSDGTINSATAGDFSASGHRVVDICSNGSYVFVITDDGTDSIIGSLDIASPTSGCGGTNWPLTLTGRNNAKGVTCIGDLIVATAYAFPYDGTVYSVARTDNALIGTCTISDNTIVEGLGTVITDGVTFWAIGWRDVGTESGKNTLYKINPWGAIAEDSSTAEVLDETTLTLSGDMDDLFGVDRDSPMVFDGDGLVVIDDQYVWKHYYAQLR